jgi:hypothetical protein
MCRSRPTRLAASVALGALAALPGCTHYHYYTAPPPVIGATVVGGAPTVVSSAPVVVGEPALTNLDPPVRAPSAIRSGPVCEVPGTPVYVSGVPARSGQIVISQPQGARTYAASPPRGYAWRKPEPESLATTRIEGGVNDATPVR